MYARDDKKHIRALIEERKAARREGARAHVKETSKRIHRELHEADRAKKKARNCKILEEFKDVKNIVNICCSGKSNLIGSIRAEDEDLKTDRDAIATVFADVHEALYAELHGSLGNQRDTSDTVMAEVEDVTTAEVKAQLKRMSKRKCADESVIILELLAYGGDELAETLAEVSTEILQGRSAIPDG